MKSKFMADGRRCISFLLCMILLLAMLPVSAGAAAAEEAKVVRAGWYEDAYNITGEHGERSGYGYEYEQSVAAYTGWSYEYVRNGWADLLEMMENGEIDLMGGISYTEERAQKMLFSELPMGTEKYYLYADLEHTDISASDLSTLNGMRVALMPTSVQATQFYEWEKSHDLHLKYVDVNSFEEGKQMAENHEIDCVLSTETPDWVEFGMSAIAVTGGSDIYFAINKDRPDLKTELDNAMRKMEQEKPFYADELHKRYLSAVSTPVLSKEEKSWLAQHGALRVGFLKEDPGISMLEESGKLSGVLTDYIALAKNSLGDIELEFTLVGFDSLDEEIQALKDGELDFIFHFTQNPYVAEENEFVLSNTVLAFNMVAVTMQNYFNENAQNRVAIQKDELLVKWYVSYYYPDWEIVDYASEDDAEKMVFNGRADCLIAESGQLEKYSENKRLHNVFLTQAGNTAFAVRRGDSLLMSILNKTLLTIPSSMLTGALYTYDSSLRKVTLLDVLKENLLVVTSGSIVLFALVVLTILCFLKKSQRAEAAATQAARQTRELNRKLQESQHELQAALQAAETASRAKTDFLASVSHDIRTPMNAIIGLTTLMKSETGLSERMQEYLTKLETSSHHLLELINNVLDMNRIESGRATLHISSVNLAEQVTQVETLVRPQVNAREQTLHIITTHLNHEYVLADPTRLQQVLVNLLSNAVKYTPQGGHILFELEELPRSNYHYARYKFIVQDDGIGMSEDFLQHIFDPFARAENSVTNQVQGTGLGMAITKNIVGLMGGVIHVDSTPGKGSRFEVTMEMPIDTEADRNVQHLSVLLVQCEKDEDFQRVQDATEGKPIHLHRTGSVEEGLDALRQATFDVVLMSLCTPEEAVQELRTQSGPNTILLGAAGPDMPEPEAKNGLDGALPYPFFLSNLETEVRRVQEIRRMADMQEDVSPLCGMRFLCAEDNEINAEILKMLLESKGASCTLYSNGQELVDAFAAVQPGDYDMILMDVQMPVMDGLEATRRIRNGKNPLGRTIPVIAMTANAFLEDMQKSREAGMDEHLSKPVDIEVLEQTVRRFKAYPPPENE